MSSLTCLKSLKAYLGVFAKHGVPCKMIHENRSDELKPLKKKQTSGNKQSEGWSIFGTSTPVFVRLGMDISSDVQKLDSKRVTHEHWTRDSSGICLAKECK